MPDTSALEFIAEAQRQARLIAASPCEAEDQAFIDSVSDWNELPPYDVPIGDEA